MKQRQRWLPYPGLSLALFGVWLLLVDSITAGHVVLAGALALVIPRLSAGFWPQKVRIRRPWLALRLLGTFLWDIVVANVTVARLILSPTSRLRPSFVRLPLGLNDELAITVLAQMISLTPGTVCMDIDLSGRYLLLHCLHITDQDVLVAQVKNRYERPVGEIFECSQS